MLKNKYPFKLGQFSSCLDQLRCLMSCLKSIKFAHLKRDSPPVCDKALLAPYTGDSQP